MEFSGQDRAGNSAKSVTIKNVFFDNLAPEASISKPIDGEPIKNSKITYLLSENLEQGFAVFKQTGGTIDSLSPHKVSLELKHRSKGLHSNVDLKLDKKLVGSGRYTVTIEGVDRAGNFVKVTPVKDIIFDVRPPKLALLSPQEGTALNQISVSYRTSEELLKGTITFSRTGGADDPGSTYTYNLTSGQLKQGEHNDVTLDLPLQDGSIYSIAFSGEDLAGNQSEPVTVSDIRYDITAPVIQINQPMENTYYQELKLAFTVDEPLKTVDIILERRGGTADADSPRSVSLEKNLLSTGKHEDINLVELLHPVDGTTYNIKIESQDLAGNRAETVEILNLVYDISPPQLSIQAPIPGGYYNNTLVSLTSSENLASGQISWERVEGESDPASPHMVELTKAYLTAGNHPDINLVMPSPVVSGAGYKITFTGIDQAGNQQSTQVEPIYFDNSPAVVTGLYPSNNTFINLQEVSFSVNEPLTEATLDWKPDAPIVATVEVSLAGTELDSGTFSRGTLQNQSNLQDGIIYSLVFHGTDRAGNTVETVLAEKVTFDITKPKFSQLVPATGARVNSPLIKWTMNEELQSGSYTWIYMGGQEDSGAPHEVNFSNDLLTKGDHDNSQLPSPELVANTMYRITLEGTDLAGNSGKKFIMSVVYDDLPPSLEILYPEAGSSVNDVDIAYEITESLKSGHFTYTRTGGELDPASPHTLELSGLELETVYKSPKTPNQPPVLQDGSVYKIEFKGTDLADNSSAADVVENVFYDVTKPVIVIQQPVKGQYTIGSMIAFSLSEDLENGTVFWTHTGGTADPRLTHELALPAEYMKAGTYKDVALSFANPLIAGGVYALSVTGTDPAGNENQPIQVEDITYIRSMAGKWYFKGAIIEVVWLFEPESGSDGSKGSFIQGLSLGTKISDQETGRYQFDFNAKPWTLTLDMDNPEKSRISLFEFIDNNHMRVVTGTKKPKSWSDGEIMEYEFRP
ncbi:MAG: Ig-like domain-containing protein, partial [Fidelibacterota bacterium]